MEKVPLCAALSALVLFGCATLPPGESQARFDMRHQVVVNIPDGAQRVRVWVCEPQGNDPDQTVRNLKVECSSAWRRVRDNEGNSFLFVELWKPSPGKMSIVAACEVDRREVRVDARPGATRPHTEAELAALSRHLKPDANVVIDERIQTLAKTICGTERNPVRQAKLIYDWVLDNTEYWVKDPDNLKASPVGSSTYCLDSGTGNCTDFHSLYAAIARAALLPTRMVYGSFFKGPLDGADQDQSYHCWIEFHAPSLGWVPLDVAVADIYVDGVVLDDKNLPKMKLTTADGYEGPDPGKVAYYFGNIEPRRVVWSRGRDLIFEPKQEGGPVNMMAKAYVEIDGKPSSDYERKLTYRGDGKR